MFYYLFASLTSLLTIQIRMCFEKQSSFPQYGQCTHICCLFRACSSMLITHSLHTTHPHSPSRGKFPLSIRTVVGCGVSWGRVNFFFPSFQQEWQLPKLQYVSCLCFTCRIILFFKATPFGVNSQIVSTYLASLAEYNL